MKNILNIFCLSAICVFLFLTSSFAAPANITSVRLGIHPDKTRFVLEIDEKPEYRIFYLPNPDRLVIDMQQVNWQTSDKSKAGIGLIENYRYGLFRQGTSRIVLDLKQPVELIREETLPPSEGKPYRFFIDIRKTSRENFGKLVQQSRQQQVAALAPRISAIPTPRSHQKYTIIVDAGHGGIDPGAIGGSGIYEKQLTLQVAKRLKSVLEADAKYNVILTRETDTFLSLRERVEIGRKYKGDLFISVHADSIGRSDIRGSTVYTLSENASDDEAAELARMHDKADVIAGVDLEEQDDTVQGILIDLAQRETMNFSVKFAKLLLPEFRGVGIKTGSRSHRFAGFRVLKAPDVPSVLVELGYLSNRHDEAFLKSEKGQKKMAEAISNALDKYFATLEP
ncbi:N-acetylmuramoyl-L-alanine amidase [Sneathiella limimaris]|uniref:N-acetylmuramoyl-L-alanine amidase n=1 Tax=Sneathiella limimaris TaxID=1964213 RepID=UPI00146A304F|nr:N-acetylmuramoyl-L-alanine amidase [Sneathiella limimaris]